MKEPRRYFQIRLHVPSPVNSCPSSSTTIRRSLSVIVLLGSLFGTLAMDPSSRSLYAADDSTASKLSLSLRYQRETAEGTGRFHTLRRAESWNPRETALIVCDVWDYHHCLNAVRRLEEFGPRLNAVIQRTRELGVTIIHSPSDCMPAYATHPARLRAQGTPPAANPPPDMELWCSTIPAEERAAYPIDQSDGGEDDDPREHAQWAEKLKQLGRNPNMPWKRQSDMISIDADRDFLSDRGDEVWNVLERRGIRNVILTGVHTNMCVLGRPFGLRQMVRGGKQVVLMSDMTDCMYNPARWPYVSHFAGNDLVIGHVERFVCPTISSDQILGGRPFRFAADRRPHLAIVMAEDGYETNRTLPELAASHLASDFRVTLIHGDPVERNEIPGLESLADADAMVVSIRRRTLKPESLDLFRRFVQAGKPVIGLRTANHAFRLREGSPPAGRVEWPEFDSQVFGGNYRGHPETSAAATIRMADNAADHPLVRGLPTKPFSREGALYLTAPLAPKASPLWIGKHKGQAEEPVAWTFTRADGGKSFYTSLGESKDFEQPAFRLLMVNAVRWGAGLEPLESLANPARDEAYRRHWTPVSVPNSLGDATHGVLADYRGPAWYRSVVRVPKSETRESLKITIPWKEDSGPKPQVWWNGHALAATPSGQSLVFVAQDKHVEYGDANLLVVRWAETTASGGMIVAPTASFAGREKSLAGRWQLRVGDDDSWANMPLPAKFGTATDIVFGF
ncbi:MAG: ThuA domain-containing protein [Pirellulales bacterium]